MISLPKQALYDYYFNNETFKSEIDKIFKNKCSQRCTLRGDLKNYVILDGDVIQGCMNKEGIKSVDCILINKNSEGKVNILLCELDSGNSGKSVTDVKQKMEDSGKHIFNVCTKKEFKINHFKCLYLGRYSHKPTKPALTRISIEGLGRNDITLSQKHCGFELNNSFFV